jgi:hypothetical protein
MYTYKGKGGTALFLNLKPESEWLASHCSLLAISKVHLLNKRLGGPLEIVAERKITASAMNQLSVFNHRNCYSC